jgi:hypothetical protein
VMAGGTFVSGLIRNTNDGSGSGRD